MIESPPLAFPKSIVAGVEKNNRTACGGAIRRLVKPLPSFSLSLPRLLFAFDSIVVLAQALELGRRRQDKKA